MSYQQSGATASASKVLIPRLDRREPPYRPGKTRDRVQRACLTCRARKVKCNGGQPKCLNCDENQAPCIYVSSRKDKLKTSTEQNQDMIRLLRELRERAGGSDRRKIEDMLAAVMDDASDASSTQIQPEKPNSLDPEDERGEANISAEVGSNGDLDILDEDLHRNEQTRATGFIGKNSEIQWIRGLHHEADHAKEIHEQYAGPYGPPGTSAEADARRIYARQRRHEKDPHPLMQTSACSFYLDDESIEMDFVVDPFELPPFETAERLLNSFMESVQDSFPILAQRTFVSQFYHYYTSVSRGTPVKLPQKWQAILNLVFAIGAAYSHLNEAEWRGDERDHLIYHSRAFALNLKDSWWYAHPDLTQMQLTGLLSFYYLAIGQTNRSWLVIGMAMRLGYALGMHVRNEDPSASASKKELLTRVWWGIYSLEQTVSSITGRPGVGLERQCSLPFPLPLSTEEITDDIIITHQSDRLRLYTTRDTMSAETSSTTSSKRGVFNTSELEAEPTNSGTFLKSTVKLGMIAQRALLELYSPTIVSKSWETIQGSIADLSEDLDAWASSLPPGLNFSQSNRDQTYQRERTTLEIYYYDTKILITRPCLRHIDRHIENQTKGSHDFNQRTAATCVAAAKAISTLLPNDMFRDRIKLYQGPWWQIVHTMMQALTILLLGISYEAIHFPVDRQDMVPSLKKLVRWLRVMKTNNGMANRAYTITISLLRKLVAYINIDISDLMSEDVAASNASSLFQFDQVGPEASTEEYSRLAEEHARHFIHNQHNPYNYAMSNPFGLPQEQVQTAGTVDPSTTFQEFFMDFVPSNSPYNNIFGGDLG